MSLLLTYFECSGLVTKPTFTTRYAQPEYSAYVNGNPKAQHLEHCPKMTSTPSDPPLHLLSARIGTFNFTRRRIDGFNRVGVDAARIPLSSYIGRSAISWESWRTTLTADLRLMSSSINDLPLYPSLAARSAGRDRRVACLRFLCGSDLERTTILPYWLLCQSRPESGSSTTAICNLQKMEDNTDFLETGNFRFVLCSKNKNFLKFFFSSVCAI